jgi:hypothetical protein
MGHTLTRLKASKFTQRALIRGLSEHWRSSQEAGEGEEEVLVLHGAGKPGIATRNLKYEA